MTKRYRYGDLIEIHSSASSYYDGRSGKIIGIAGDYPETNFYIVEIDGGTHDGIWSAAVWPAGCLRPLEKNND